MDIAAPTVKAERTPLEQKLKEISGRLSVAGGHPDKAVRRQAQGVIATSDAPWLLQAVLGLMGRVVELETLRAGMEQALRNHAEALAVILADAGGEIRVPKDFADTFELKGGWRIEVLEDTVAFRAMSEEDIAAAEKVDAAPDA